MEPTAISGISVDKRWRFSCLTLVVCLVVSSLPETIGQKQEGDACVTSSGQSGTCVDLYSCPSITSPPSTRDTCGFRRHTPIVCCQNQPIGRRDNVARPSRQRNARQTEAPWWALNGRPFTTFGTPTNWWQPNPQEGEEEEEEEEVYTPSTRRPTTTTRRPTTATTRRTTTTRRPRPQPTTSRPRPSTSGSISDAKCREYSRPVQPLVEALPLLPNADTIKVPVEKCKFNRLELIVGGTNTSVGEYPHMAAIGYKTNGGENEYEFLCGGSLISENFVLTAGHCTFSKTGKLSIVRLGELNLKSDFDGADPVDYPVEDIIRHPQYKYPVHYNDIALLRLGRQVTFNDNIRPACLYTRSSFKVNKAIATGWGKIGFTDDPSDIMLKVSIDIVSNPVCNRLYAGLAASSSKLTEGIVPSMMCAGDLKGGKDSCQGDSGGPLQIANEKNQCIHYLVGITSFGMFCGLKNSAGVYTRVSAFIPWIESEVWPTG